MNVKRTYRKKTNKKRTYAKKTTRVSKNLTKAISKVINRKAETKSTGINETQYVFSADNDSLQPSVNLADAFDLSQSTGDGGRIGNTIECTKAVLNLTIRRNASTAPTTYNLPCIVSIFIGYLRNNRGENPDSYASTSLFKDGASVLPWNGTMLRTLRTVNKKMFSVLHRYDFKIGSSIVGTNFPGFSNNDFKIHYHRKILLKEMLGKITYTDDAISTGHNKDLWMFASYCNINDYVDDITASIGNTQVDIQYFVDVEYKDI